MNHYAKCDRCGVYGQTRVRSYNPESHEPPDGWAEREVPHQWAEGRRSDAKALVCRDCLPYVDGAMIAAWGEALKKPAPKRKSDA